MVFHCLAHRVPHLELFPHSRCRYWSGYRRILSSFISQAHDLRDLYPTKAIVCSRQAFVAVVDKNTTLVGQLECSSESQMMGQETLTDTCFDPHDKVVEDTDKIALTSLGRHLHYSSCLCQRKKSGVLRRKQASRRPPQMQVRRQWRPRQTEQVCTGL